MHPKLKRSGGAQHSAGRGQQLPISMGATLSLETAGGSRVLEGQATWISITVTPAAGASLSTSCASPVPHCSAALEVAPPENPAVTNRRRVEGPRVASPTSNEPGAVPGSPSPHKTPSAHTVGRCPDQTQLVARTGLAVLGVTETALGTAGASESGDMAGSPSPQKTPTARTGGLCPSNQAARVVRADLAALEPIGAPQPCVTLLDPQGAQADPAASSQTGIAKVPRKRGRPRKHPLPQEGGSGSRGHSQEGRSQGDPREPAAAQLKHKARGRGRMPGLERGKPTDSTRKAAVGHAHRDSGGGRGRKKGTRAGRAQQERSGVAAGRVIPDKEGTAFDDGLAGGRITLLSKVLARSTPGYSSHWEVTRPSVHLQEVQEEEEEAHIEGGNGEGGEQGKNCMNEVAIEGEREAQSEEGVMPGDKGNHEEGKGVHEAEEEERVPGEEDKEQEGQEVPVLAPRPEAVLETLPPGSEPDGDELQGEDQPDSELQVALLDAQQECLLDSGEKQGGCLLDSGDRQGGFLLDSGDRQGGFLLDSGEKQGEGGLGEEEGKEGPGLSGVAPQAAGEEDACVGLGCGVWEQEARTDSTHPFFSSEQLQPAEQLRCSCSAASEVPILPKAQSPARRTPKELAATLKERALRKFLARSGRSFTAFVQQHGPAASPAPLDTSAPAQAVTGQAGTGQAVTGQAASDHNGCDQANLLGDPSLHGGRVQALGTGAQGIPQDPKEAASLEAPDTDPITAPVTAPVTVTVTGVAMAREGAAGACTTRGVDLGSSCPPGTQISGRAKGSALSTQRGPRDPLEAYVQRMGSARLRWVHRCLQAAKAQGLVHEAAIRQDAAVPGEPSSSAVAKASDAQVELMEGQAQGKGQPGTPVEVTRHTAAPHEERTMSSEDTTGAADDVEGTGMADAVHTTAEGEEAVEGAGMADAVHTTAEGEEAAEGVAGMADAVVTTQEGADAASRTEAQGPSRSPPGTPVPLPSAEARSPPAPAHLRPMDPGANPSNLCLEALPTTPPHALPSATVSQLHCDKLATAGVGSANPCPSTPESAAGSDSPPSKLAASSLRTDSSPPKPATHPTPTSSPPKLAASSPRANDSLPLPATHPTPASSPSIPTPPAADGKASSAAGSCPSPLQLPPTSFPVSREVKGTVWNQRSFSGSIPSTSGASSIVNFLSSTPSAPADFTPNQGTDSRVVKGTLWNLSRCQQPPSSAELPVAQTAGEEKGSAGKEQGTAAEENSTAGEENSTAGEENNTAGEENIAAGEDTHVAVEAGLSEAEAVGGAHMTVSLDTDYGASQGSPGGEVGTRAAADEVVAEAPTAECSGVPEAECTGVPEAECTGMPEEGLGDKELLAVYHVESSTGKLQLVDSEEGTTRKAEVLPAGKGRENPAAAALSHCADDMDALADVDILADVDVLADVDGLDELELEPLTELDPLPDMAPLPEMGGVLQVAPLSEDPAAPTTKQESSHPSPLGTSLGETLPCAQLQGHSGPLLAPAGAAPAVAATSASAPTTQAPTQAAAQAETAASAAPGANQGPPAIPPAATGAPRVCRLVLKGADNGGCSPASGAAAVEGSPEGGDRFLGAQCGIDWAQLFGRQAQELGGSRHSMKLLLASKCQQTAEARCTEGVPHEAGEASHQQQPPQSIRLPLRSRRVQVPQSLASDPATWPALDDAEAEDSRALPCGHRKTPCCDAPDCVACGAPGGSPPSKEGAPCLSREREPALASLAGSAGLRSAGSPVKGVKRGSTAGVVYPGEAPASSHQKIPMSKHVRRLVTAGGAVAVPGLKLTAGAQAVHRGQTVRHHPLGDYRQGDTSASPPQGPPLGEGSPEAHQRCTKRPRPMTSLRFPEHAGGRLEASSPPVYPRGTYLSPSYDPGSTSAARSEYDLRVQNLKSRTGLKGILKWGSSPLVPETSAQVGPQEHPGCTPEGKRKLHELWPSSVHSNDGDSNSAGGRTDMDSCGAANGSGGKGSEAGAGREGGAPERGRSEGVLATEGRERGVPLLVRAAGEGYGAASGVPAGLGANRVMEDREGDGELASFRAKLQALPVKRRRVCFADDAGQPMEHVLVYTAEASGPLKSCLEINKARVERRKAMLEEKLKRGRLNRVVSPVAY